MIQYPKTIMEFEREFSSEKKCIDYIMKLRYPDGKYTCSICGSKKSWPVRERTYECAECHRQESILSGIVFQDTQTIDVVVQGNMVYHLAEERCKCAWITACFGYRGI